MASITSFFVVSCLGREEEAAGSEASSDASRVERRMLFYVLFLKSRLFSISKTPLSFLQNLCPQIFRKCSPGESRTACRVRPSNTRNLYCQEPFAVDCKTAIKK